MRIRWILVIVLVNTIAAGCSSYSRTQILTQPAELFPSTANPASSDTVPSTSGTSPPDPTLVEPAATIAPTVIDSSLSPNGEWVAETIRLTEGSRDLVLFIVRSTAGDRYWTVEERVFEDIPLTGFAFPEPFMWSHDGKSLYFTHRGGGDGCFVPTEESGQGLLKLNLDLGEVIEILDRPASWMAISPGEDTLAYVESWQQLVLRDLEAGTDGHVLNLFDNDEQACPFESEITGIYWSPQGDHLLGTFICGPCGIPWVFSSVYIIDPNTHSTRAVLSQSKTSLMPIEWPEPDRIVLIDTAGERWEFQVSTGNLISVND